MKKLLKLLLFFAAIFSISSISFTFAAEKSVDAKTQDLLNSVEIDYCDENFDIIT